MQNYLMIWFVFKCILDNITLSYHRLKGSNVIMWNTVMESLIHGVSYSLRLWDDSINSKQFALIAKQQKDRQADKYILGKLT